MSSPIRVQFVCLGNICRSPLAKVVFREKVNEAGLAEHFEIVSSGTGSWHVGEKADDRMRKTAQRKGLSLEDHRASQFEAVEFERSDHIIVMDKSNLNDVLRLDENNEYSDKVRLFREFDPEPGDYEVPDPYHGGRQGFERVFDIVNRTAEELLDRFVEEYDLAGRVGGEASN